MATLVVEEHLPGPDAYWQRVGDHFDRQCTRERAALPPADLPIAHDHAGLILERSMPEVADEAGLRRILFESECVTTRRGADLLDVRIGEYGLDCGCGLGGSSFMLARERGARMDGITVSPRELERATAAAEVLGLESMTSFSLENIYSELRPSCTYDFVWACESTAYMPDKPRLFAEWHRILKPGGRVLVLALSCIDWLRHGVRTRIARLEAQCAMRIEPFQTLPDAAARAGFSLHDLVSLEQESIPYWRLRMRSKQRTGSESWMLDGLERGAFRVSMMVFRRI